MWAEITNASILTVFLRLFAFCLDRNVSACRRLKQNTNDVINLQFVITATRDLSVETIGVYM